MTVVERNGGAREEQGVDLTEYLRISVVAACQSQGSYALKHAQLYGLF